MERIATKGGGAVDNFSLALALYELADLLELRGEDAFKVRAYQRAAQALEQLPEEAAAIAARAGAAGLMKVPGIGKAIAEKLMELLTTGSLARLEELRAALPPGLKQLVAVPGLGARTASLLFGRLGIASLDDLELAARQGRLRDLPGFSRRREEQVLAKIPAVRQRLTRTPSAALLPLARAMATALAAQPGVQRAEVAGSLRRGCDTAADIDLVLAAADPGAALQALGILRSAQETAPGHWQAESSRGHRIDVYITPTAGFGAQRGRGGRRGRRRTWSSCRRGRRRAVPPWGRRGCKRPAAAWWRRVRRRRSTGPWGWPGCRRSCGRARARWIVVTNATTAELAGKEKAVSSIPFMILSRARHGD